MSQSSIIAYVDQRPVTETDIQFLLHTIGPERAEQFKSPEGRKQLVDELINQELFYSDAIEHGLHETPSFMRELERMTVNLVKQFSIRAFLDSVEVDEAEVKAIYDQNPQQFERKEEVRASHILVPTEEAALAIREDIQSGKLSFEEAARQHSSCPSKAQGGDLSYFSRGQMVPEFEMACFGGEVGELTAPVQTQFGFHLIQITDKKPVSVMAFEEVKGHLEQQALVHKQNQLFYEKVKDLKQKYEIKMVE